MVHERHVNHMLDRMRRRGWDEASLAHAHKVLSKKREPLFFVNRIQELLHWLVFVIIVFVNFFASAAVIPFLVIFPNPGLYAILMIMGACFGILFAVILSDINHVFTALHKLTVALVIPTLAVVNVILIVSYFDFRYSNVFGEIRHPVTLGLFYGVPFIIPYFLLLFVQWLVKRG